MEFYLPLKTYKNDYNKLRRAYIIIIANLIKEHLLDQNINNYTDTIIDIEKSCYDHSIEIADYELLLPDFDNKQFEQLYRTKISRITKNLDINSEVADDYLINLVIDRKIDIKNISKMTPEELSPAKNAKLLEELNTRREQKVQLKVSSDYMCPKCRKKQCLVRSVQTRALDEGSSFFATCAFCSHVWRL